MKNSNDKVRYLTEVALLIAIILVMKLTGLASIPVGPLVMTFTMIPIAIGAMISGPLAGAILGLVFGFTSFYDAVTGASLMTGAFFQLSPISTFVLCVGTRTLVGALTGWIFRGLKKIDKTDTVCYFATGLLCPLLNTLLFMGYIVWFFYSCDYVQGLVSTLGATGPIMFVVLSVGVQGLVEWITGAIVGGGVGKAVAHALKRV
ncbi:MAG: ECF transporter S component [Clostridiales bacterium]|nr:ECF transporter S component [Clostridiales bacterium]